MVFDPATQFKDTGSVSRSNFHLPPPLQQCHESAWGQEKETLLMTYKALKRSIINYAAPVWSINTSNTYMNLNQVAIDHTRCLASTTCIQEANILNVYEHPEFPYYYYRLDCISEMKLN